MFMTNFVADKLLCLRLDAHRLLTSLLTSCRERNSTRSEIMLARSSLPSNTRDSRTWRRMCSMNWSAGSRSFRTCVVLPVHLLVVVGRSLEVRPVVWGSDTPLVLEVRGDFLRAKRPWRL